MSTRWAFLGSETHRRSRLPQVARQRGDDEDGVQGERRVAEKRLRRGMGRCQHRQRCAELCADDTRGPHWQKWPHSCGCQRTRAVPYAGSEPRVSPRPRAKTLPRCGGGSCVRKRLPSVFTLAHSGRPGHLSHIIIRQQNCFHAHIRAARAQCGGACRAMWRLRTLLLRFLGLSGSCGCGAHRSNPCRINNNSNKTMDRCHVPVSIFVNARTLR